MALIIKEENGVFLLTGSINADTAKDFQKHCLMLLNTYGNLTIDIENVSAIDANGLLAMKVLYHNALDSNQIFYIVGTGCKEIYDEFRYSPNAA